MKLQAELNNIIKKFSTLSKDTVINYARMLKKSGEYNDFITALAWNIALATVTTSIICELYEKYNCNDSHLTTLFRKALLETFPEVKTI